MNSDQYQSLSTARRFSSWQLIALGLVLLLLGSCNKFLDVLPKDKIPQDALLENEQGFKDAAIGIYLGMDKPKNGGKYGLYTTNLSMGMVSVMGYNYDNANTTNAGGGDNIFTNSVYYNYMDAIVRLEIDGVWGGMYNNIANINNILKQLNGKQGLFTDDNYERVKGELTALRALFHFDLVRLFGQPPLTAGASKAIPYVTNFTVSSTPFATVSQVLDSCIIDLTSAREMLSKTDTSALVKGADDVFKAYTQNHLNFWAVEALLARVYLYKGDYENAAKFAHLVIGSGKFPLISSNVASSLNPVRDRLFSQELLFSVYSTNIANYNSTFFDISSGTPLRLTPAGKNKIYTTGSGSVNDYRYTSWFDNNQSNTQVPSKYFQDPNLPYELQGLVPVLRVSEMYYIGAECQNHKQNVEAGVALLNQVRVARGLDPLDYNNMNSDSLATEIMQAYQKEFIQEGQTFYYYKRLNMDIKQASGNPAVIPANVYVWPVPDKEIEYNH